MSIVDRLNKDNLEGHSAYVLYTSNCVVWRCGPKYPVPQQTSSLGKCGVCKQNPTGAALLHFEPRLIS